MHQPSQRHRERWILLAKGAAVFLAIFVTAGGSMLLARHTGTVMSIWIPNGILVAVLLYAPERRWLAYLLIYIAAFMLAHDVASGGLLGSHPWMAIALALINCVEILIVATAIHHGFPQIAEDTRFLRLGRIAFASTLVASAVSALMAALILRVVIGAPYWNTADWWFRSRVLGMVIVGTLSLVTLIQQRRMFGHPGSRLRMLRDVALHAAITIAVFAQSRYPLLFIVFAPLLYLVFHYRFPGLVIGIAIVAAVTTVATALGRGPFDLILAATSGERALLAQVYLGVLCVVAVPVALALADRRRLERQVGESESRYRLLADYASDLIMRISRDGTRRYVSPSVKELLGWDVDEFMDSGVELIHPDDRAPVAAAVARLWETGKPSLTEYRVRRRSGDYLWLEALARVAPSPDRPGDMELVYTGRDITEAKEAQQALAESEQRLRTITDNVPAVIAHIDAEQRYTFVNGYVSTMVGIEPSAMLGRTVEDVRGPEVYAVLRPHIELALTGAATTFEYEARYGNRHDYYQATYLPARSANGDPNGIIALTTEITRIKQAERQLAFLAHHDTLTGIANRLSFNEGIDSAIRHASLIDAPLMLMMIDVDHFKQINDTNGHAAGDAVLHEVAHRLQAAIRASDLLARLGGDEFVILCEDITTRDAAEALARKVTATMTRPVVFEDRRLQVTLSVGVALCRGVDNADALMHTADQALYRAKERGRARYDLTSDTP
ncbi:diguanylate cyclase [Dyella sp. EPa41]|uniref:diguanylate cyclase domain-containing protein n=1 Tax=Dyella sp. EPa41 TaxID=1561194 RepID=UPI00191570E7|nr:diguanylate cyclase [Dyella sp. EPa41]